MTSSPQECPICKVTIDPALGANEEVRFSSGRPASRTKLWARVCQFTKAEGCINSDPALRSTPSKADFYGEPPTLEPGGESQSVSL
ncbi:MAG: hypothetical protein VKJ87_01270 [Synechococcus sp.]|nr:hypothetical protein [Synechococcus sp.]